MIRPVRPAELFGIWDPDDPGGGAWLGYPIGDGPDAPAPLATFVDEAEAIRAAVIFEEEAAARDGRRPRYVVASIAGMSRFQRETSPGGN